MKAADLKAAINEHAPISADEATEKIVYTFKASICDSVYQERWDDAESTLGKYADQFSQLFPEEDEQSIKLAIIDLVLESGQLDENHRSDAESLRDRIA